VALRILQKTFVLIFLFAFVVFQTKVPVVFAVTTSSASVTVGATVPEQESEGSSPAPSNPVPSNPNVPPPSAPLEAYDIKVTDITTTSFKMSAQYNKNASDSFKLYYFLNGKKTTLLVGAHPSPSKSPKFSFPNLPSGAKVYYEVIASAPALSEVYTFEGNVQLVKTDSTVPAVLNFTSIPEGSNLVRITWSTDETAKTELFVRDNPSAQYTSRYISATATTSFNTLLQGSPGSTVNAYVVATDLADNSAQSQVYPISFAVPPPVKFLSMKVDSVTISSARVLWSLDASALSTISYKTSLGVTKTLAGPYAKS
jgi:hypothetical protein